LPCRGKAWPNKKNTASNLLLSLQLFAFLLDAQPSEVQEAFRFLLATATHEAGKFELVSVIDEQRSKK
jgi:hypothetical protein